MELLELLEKAKCGNLEPCRSCPWSPAGWESFHVAFGASCREHGIDYESSSKAVSISIAQDPANTTPSETGRLCAVHNSQEYRDKTTQNWLELWKAAVAQSEGEDHDPYLGNHYWTNAIMHGVPTAYRTNKQKTQAQRQCAHVLREQIKLLSPKVVVACGEVTAKSLLDTRLVSQRWSELSKRFPTEVYTEVTNGTVFYCTYHTAKRAVNRGAARRYDPELTEERLEQKLGDLGESAAARDFLGRHSESSVKSRGMRLLLLHWLDIGETIRTAHSGGASVD